MIILTIVNEKGGNAKTTTSINVGAGLARTGRKVLIVDADPQGNAATFLGFSPAPGTYTLLACYISALASLMRDPKEQVRSFLRSSGRENLWLLPGSQETVTAIALILSGECDLSLLRRAIHEHFADFDVVILDTPPSLGGSLELAMWASDYVLMPVACETAGIEGARQTIGTLRSLTSRGWNGQLLGVVPTFYDERTVERRESLKTLRKLFPNLVFDPIHETAAIRELPSNQMTIFEKFEAEKSNLYARRAAEEFSALTEAVVRRMK